MRWRFVSSFSNAVGFIHQKKQKERINGWIPALEFFFLFIFSLGDEPDNKNKREKKHLSGSISKEKREKRKGTYTVCDYTTKTGQRLTESQSRSDQSYGRVSTHSLAANLSSHTLCGHRKFLSLFFLLWWEVATQCVEE